MAFLMYKKPKNLLSIYFIGNKKSVLVSPPILRLPNVVQTWKLGEKNTPSEISGFLHSTAFRHIYYNALTCL